MAQRQYQSGNKVANVAGKGRAGENGRSGSAGMAEPNRCSGGERFGVGPRRGAGITTGAYSGRSVRWVGQESASFYRPQLRIAAQPQPRSCARRLSPRTLHPGKADYRDTGIRYTRGRRTLIILSAPRGPSDVRTMSATAIAATIHDERTSFALALEPCVVSFVFFALAILNLNWTTTDYWGGTRPIRLAYWLKDATGICSTPKSAYILIAQRVCLESGVQIPDAAPQAFKSFASKLNPSLPTRSRTLQSWPKAKIGRDF